MNILILENRGSVANYLAEALEAKGHIVFRAHSINDAQTCWDNRADKPVDCIIADLNMYPDGLKYNEIKQTQEGLLSGWVWLRGYVLKEDASMRGRIIIYSDYLPDLRRFVTPTSELDGIALIPKLGSASPAKGILERVASIARHAN